MYAVNVSTHDLYSLNSSLERIIREKKQACSTKFKRAFYACKVKGHVVRFYETYEEAYAERVMLFITGDGE